MVRPDGLPRRVPEALERGLSDAGGRSGRQRVHLRSGALEDVRRPDGAAGRRSRRLPRRDPRAVGQNGSGKSTLIKILASFHAPGPGGQLTVERASRLPLPLALDPARLGMSFVHQDLGADRVAEVFENVRIGRYRTRFGWRISWRAERRLVARCSSASASRSSRRARLLATPGRPARRSRSRVRSTGFEGIEHGLLVLDEPTPHLPRDGVEPPVRGDPQRRGRRHGILFVTHRLDEVLELADRVTVLRDGARRRPATDDGAGCRPADRS